MNLPGCIMYSFLNASILSLLILLFSKLKYIHIPFAIILTLLVCIDVVHIVCYNSLLNIGAVGSMFETDMGEAKDFIHSRLKFLPFFPLFFFFIYMSLREGYRVKIKKTLCLLSLYFFFFLGIITIQNFFKLREIFGRRNLPIKIIHFYYQMYLPLGVNSVVITMGYLDEMSTFRKHIDYPKELMDGIDLTQTSDTPQNIFVVIGESSLRTHYSLYNYKYPTTPFLDSLSLDNKLKYYNTISVASVTRDAIRLTLSFASPLDPKPFYENENVISMANIIGYNTFWISNQTKVGVSDSYIGLLASYAQEVVFSEDDFYTGNRDDFDLINIVDNRLKSVNNDSKNVFFIHIKGSHQPYMNKYDGGDRFYLQDFEDPEGECFVYDCTIRHTDRFLRKLFDVMKNNSKDTPSVILYFSDHGEVINEGHGIMLSDDEILKNEYQIPFIVIPSTDSINFDQHILPYINDGILNSNSISYILSSLFGYILSDQVLEKANYEAQHFTQVDGSVHLVKDKKLFVE